jgi:hypothetical protein
MSSGSTSAVADHARHEDGRAEDEPARQHERVPWPDAQTSESRATLSATPARTGALRGGELKARARATSPCAPPHQMHGLQQEAHREQQRDGTQQPSQVAPRVVADWPGGPRSSGAHR